MDPRQELEELRRLEELEAKAQGGATPYDVNAGVASAMNIGQALTFGFGDEIAGALGGDKERYRATVEQFRQEYPKSAMLGTVSASMLPGLALVKGLRAAPALAPQMLSQMPPAAAAVTGGAASSALQGVGDAATVADIPRDASTNAIGGAIAAPVLMGATKGIGSVAGALGGQAATRIPGGVGNALSEMLARNRVATALNRDRLDASALEARLNELGPEARTVDAGGENIRSILDINATLPGRTKNALELAIRERQASRPGRLDPVVDMASNGQGRASQVYALWQQQKEMAAAPLYARVNSMQVPTTPELRAQLQAAERLGAFGEAETIATARELPFSLDPMGQRLSMRDLDNVKRGMDQLIARETKPDGSVTPKGQAFTELRRRMIDTLDGLTTDRTTGQSAYRQARDAFAGPAQMQDALQRGRRFLSGDADSLGMTMAGLSDSERDAFRIGAAEALRQKFGAPSGQTEFLNIWKNRNLQEKLETLFDNPQQMAEAMRRLENEGTLKRMESLGRGSQTAGRLQGAEDQTMGVAEDMIGMVGKAKAGMWPSLIAGMGKYSAQLGTPEPVRDAIGDILLGRNRNQLADLIAAQTGLRNRKTANALASIAITNQTVPAATRAQGNK